jgi:hypothetical protein
MNEAADFKNNRTIENTSIHAGCKSTNIFAQQIAQRIAFTECASQWIMTASKSRFIDNTGGLGRYTDEIVWWS